MGESKSVFALSKNGYDEGRGAMPGNVSPDKRGCWESAK